MTKFVKRVIGKDENLVCVSRVHWVYGLSGLIWFAALTAFGFYANMWLWEWFAYDESIFSRELSFLEQEFYWLVYEIHYPWIFGLFAACGLMIFVVHMLKIIATEIALTERRLIYKTGLIFVKVDEIDVAEIRAEQVNHGFFGRFLRYGSIHLDCRFVGDIYLPAIYEPYHLLKAIHAARKNMHDPLENE